MPKSRLRLRDKAGRWTLSEENDPTRKILVIARAQLVGRLFTVHLGISRGNSCTQALASFFHSLSSAPNSSAPVLDPAARETLLAYDWPGNVREPKNAMEHAAAIAPQRIILASDLPLAVQSGIPVGRPAEETLSRTVIKYAVALPDAPGGRCHKTLEQAERALIAYAMNRFRGNQSEASDYLGLHRNTLRNKLRDLGIHASDKDE